MAQKLTIKDLQKEVETLTQKWKRALADYANLERRIALEKQEFVKFSNACLVDKIIAALDTLEKAEVQLKDKGLTLGVNQLRESLKSEGLSEIPVLGEKFDPLKMDCVEMIKGEKNKVISVCQKGYLLNTKVLRPAKVKVGSSA